MPQVRLQAVGSGFPGSPKHLWGAYRAFLQKLVPVGIGFDS